MSDLIKFITSSVYLPSNVVVSFNGDISLPNAHSCYNEIVLPTKHRVYTEFKTSMERGLEHGTGYGLG